MIHLSRIGITVAVVLAATFWTIYLVFSGDRTLSWSDAAPFGFVVSALVVAGLLFEYRFWKTPRVQRLVSRPNLEGTWKGQLETTYKDSESGEPRPPIICYLAVTQTYSTLKMRLLTEESNSWLISDDLTKSSKGGGHQVVGVYTNHPKARVRERSEVHFGALWLDTHGGDSSPTGMSGEYWTDRETKGSISLSSRVEEIHSRFEDAKVAFLNSDS